MNLTPAKSLDLSRRLSSVEFDPSAEHRVAEGEVGAALLRASLNRGGLTVAAQLLGLSELLVSQSAVHAGSQPIRTPRRRNQAVKHLLADVAVQLEYARPVVARAAYTVGVSPSGQTSRYRMPSWQQHAWRSSPRVRQYKFTGNGLHLGV